MRYQELMQSLEQELRAVLLIQKQDSSALKSCTAEQKDSLRLAQKLLKAYKSGLPIQEFWGLLGGKGKTDTNTCEEWLKARERDIKPLQEKIQKLCNQPIPVTDRALVKTESALNSFQEQLELLEQKYSSIPESCEVNHSDFLNLRSQIKKKQELCKQLKHSDVYSRRRLRDIGSATKKRIESLQSPHSSIEVQKERQAILELCKSFDENLQEALQSTPLKIIKNAEGYETRMNKEGELIIRAGINSLAMLAHELQHVIQYSKGQLIFLNAAATKHLDEKKEDSSIWLPSYNIGDETEAYRLQFAFDPENSTLPNPKPQCLADIDDAYVRQIDDNGKKYYEDLPAQALSKKSKLGDLGKKLKNRTQDQFLTILEKDYPDIDKNDLDSKIKALFQDDTKTLEELLEEELEFKLGNAQSLKLKLATYVKYK